MRRAALDFEKTSLLHLCAFTCLHLSHLAGDLYFTLICHYADPCCCCCCWVVLLYLFGRGRGLLVLIKSSSKGEVTQQTKVVAECSFSFHLLGGFFFFLILIFFHPFKPKSVEFGHQLLTSPAWHVRYQSLSQFGSLSFWFNLWRQSFRQPSFWMYFTQIHIVQCCEFERNLVLSGTIATLDLVASK